MKILFLNPNATVRMTEDVVVSARKVAQAEILGWTNTAGPPAIQGPEDGAAAVPGLMAMLPAARDAGVDAIVIACFDDTGLAELRMAAHCPVIGIGQAGYHMATLLGQRFSVVTTLDVSVPVIAENIAAGGFAGRCGGVHASGIPVLSLEQPEEATILKLIAAINAATGRDGTDVAVLGCAGMSALAPRLGLACTVDVVDGVASAVLLAEAAIRFQRLRPARPAPDAQPALTA